MSKREIYTYTDLTKLNENKLFSEIKKYSIITVSADLRKGLKGTLEKDRVEGIFSKDEAIRITEFHNLSQALNKDWGTDQCKFNEMVVLSEYLRRMIEEDDKKQINWLTGCMRNTGSFLSAITMLEQAGVRPEDICTGEDRNLILLQQAWEYLAERDAYIKNFRRNMSQSYTKEMWNTVLRTAFSTDYAFDKTEALIFMGFYFITPLQEQIMSLLEKAGYRLIFLIPYDERHSFVHEIWEDTYSEERGYPPKSEWHIEKAKSSDPYGELFEGRKGINIPNKLRIREYASEMEFVDDVKNIRKEGYSIYSSDFKTANQILKDYFPDAYGDRKILSYPIGQFISVLNQMWDDDRQTVILTEDNLIECFSSGWLSENGISGRRYLQDLFYIMPFFDGCETAQEWIDRIELLKKIQNDAEEPFRIDSDAEESVARWQEAIGNPLINFSPFSIDSKKLDIITSLIRQVLDMATELFGKQQTVRVSDHIRKLDHILKRHEVSKEIYDEERSIVGDIFEKLGQPGEFDAECNPSDIARALNFYLCGRFEEGEIQTNRVGLVYPMYFIDAACIKNKSKVHICMCDVNAMPGGNKEYVWPLTSDVIRDCYKKTRNQLLVNMMQIMENTSLCNRYFMYCALKNKDVTVSWVSTIGDKKLAPSPYIKLILEATRLKLTPAKQHALTFARVADSIYGEGRITEYDNRKMPSDTIKEARMDYAVCPMKYVLGYVLEKYPTYQSEFQQSYALNAFISAIFDLMQDKGMSKEVVYRNVMSLFPNMRKAEKRQVYDYISYDQRENFINYRDRTRCGDFYYSDERLKLHFPNTQVREMAVGRFGKLLTPDGRQGMNLFEVMEATNDEEMQGKKDIVKMTCMFCPHVDYCRNAVYSGDQDNYYD